jgi:branched-chain amino acid transport system permease protein
MATLQTLQNSSIAQRATAVFLIALGLAPFALGTVWIMKVTAAFYLGVFAMTWDFTSGYTGQISFGHTLFFATGGYTSALLIMGHSLHPALSLALAVLAAMIAGLAVGYPALRLRGPYLSLLTMLAPLILLRLFIIYSDIFGGNVGLIGTPDYFSDPITNFYIAYVFFVLVLVAFYVITRSDVGDVFTAIKEDEDVVRSVGLNVAKFKIFSFVFSAMVGGLAGALFVHSLVGSTTPNQLLTLSLNIDLIVAAIIGGMGTITGAAFGGFAFYLIRDYLGGVDATVPLIDVPFHSLNSIILYLLAVIILFYLPDGVVPWLLDSGRTLGAKYGIGRPKASDGGRPKEEVDE